MMISNEEKAKRIAEACNMAYLAMENDGGVYEVDSFADCEQSSMLMAEWKDSQAAEAYCKCCNECKDHSIDICNKLKNFMTIMKGGDK